VAARCRDDPESLWLGSAGLGDSDVGALCEGLRRGGSQLTSLDLSRNSIADVGVQRLTTAFASGLCPKLEQLWLDGNSFGVLGTEMLKSGLGALRRNLTVHVDPSSAGVADSGSNGTTSRHHECRGDGRGRSEPDDTSSDRHTKHVGGPELTTDGPVSPAGREPELRTEAPASICGGVDDACGAASAHQRPADACIEVVGGGSGGSTTVRATVRLPDGVVSAKDLKLDISAWRFIVVQVSTGSPVVDASLPCAVDPASAVAAFSRRKRAVTVTMQPSVTRSA